MCTFAQKYLHATKTDITHNYKKKYLEICAVELETKASTLIILSLYRAPSVRRF